MVAMSHDRTWALAGEAPTVRPVPTEYSTPIAVTGV